MTAGERPFRWILGGSVVLVLLVNALVPRPTDWSDSFAARDARPYGSEVIRTALPDLFGDTSVTSVAQPPYEHLGEKTGAVGESGKAAYVFVTDRFAPDEKEANRLLRFAEAGNTLFVAAHAWSDHLRDTLGIGVDAAGRPSLIDTLGTGWIAWTENEAEHQAPVRGGTTTHVLRGVDTTAATVLARGWQVETPILTEDSLTASPTRHPTQVRLDWGKGTILLSSTPRLFTNYHALASASAPAVWAGLSRIPATARPVWWDAYHKPGTVQRKSDSPIRYVLSQPALRNAYVTLLVGLLLFLGLQGRRRQRVIPVREPPENATVDFVETVGELYHRRGDHAALARKRAQYFLTTLHDAIDLAPHAFDSAVEAGDEARAEWVDRVARRTGVPRSDVADLADALQSARHAERITADDLHTLDDRLHAFHQKRAR